MLIDSVSRLPETRQRHIDGFGRFVIALPKEVSSSPPAKAAFRVSA
jgi:hypothetical protein